MSKDFKEIIDSFLYGYLIDIKKICFLSNEEKKIISTLIEIYNSDPNYTLNLIKNNSVRLHWWNT